MDCLFENIHTRDKKLLQEVYSYYFFKRPIAILLHALMGIITVQSIVLLITDLQNGGWIGILFPIFLYPFMIWSYRKTVKISYARELENHRDQISNYMISVTDTHITHSSANGGFVEIGFEQIKDTFTTKRYLVLRSKANMYYIFAKGGFTKGTYEEFCRFIASKGFQVKQ